MLLSCSPEPQYACRPAAASHERLRQGGRLPGVRDNLSLIGPPTTAAERRRWDAARRRGRGRPKIGKGTAVVSVTIERDLLAWADAYAKKMGLTRARLVGVVLESMRHNVRRYRTVADEYDRSIPRPGRRPYSRRWRRHPQCDRALVCLLDRRPTAGPIEVPVPFVVPAPVPPPAGRNPETRLSTILSCQTGAHPATRYAPRGRSIAIAAARALVKTRNQL